MTMNTLSQWQRTEFEKTPIYIRPDRPDWFVPNPAADRLLEKELKTGEPSSEAGLLLQRISQPKDPEPRDYQYRSDRLDSTALKECWLHITNQCNMSCTHCMFQSSPHATDELTTEDCSAIIDEAYGLGCRIFYFTGGEPLLSRAFYPGVKKIFSRPDTHVVLLTNLSLISREKENLADLPRERLHFQVSVDGMEKNHEKVRGTGTFSRLSRDLHTLDELGFPATLAMTITGENVHEMADIIEFAATHKVAGIHYLWLFHKGNAEESLFVPSETIFPHLVKAWEAAQRTGVKIDNIEMLKSQVFSCPGTRYDLSNAGWESLAVGPDRQIYPTPALVYNRGMACGSLDQGLEQIRQNSPVLKEVQKASLNNSPAYRENPFCYIVGGGDIDHSYIHGKSLTGHDPYLGLYTLIVQWLIAREALKYQSPAYPALLLKMGDKLGDCPAQGADIFFTHSNCVLSIPGHDSRTRINQFYSKAAQDTQEDIINPVCYEEKFIQHIPKENRFRSYGCGSPVIEADIRPGEAVLDLGSGTGIECFIAARLTGPRGQVTGIDMGDAMLSAAGAAKPKVVENLGYDRIEFKKSFLEELPIPDGSIDLVISNCVLNLSPDKRRVFSEIFRVLKPGGRMVISDITFNDPIPLSIKYNETLRGECIGGALNYYDLFGILNDLGYSNSKILKGYHYRSVQGYDFYSITYQGIKPDPHTLPRLYDFPDFTTTMAGVESEPTCACFVKPEQPSASTPSPFQKVNCMVCGEDLVYFETHKELQCQYCKKILPANARCTKGHFVCDHCHSTDGVEILLNICLSSKTKDAARLMQEIRSHPNFPIHGPEHHALVPAVILTALRNTGESISEDQIRTGIERGKTIAGGACAFLGICGAAAGAGIAFSVLLGATPYEGEKRQKVQKITQTVLGKISDFNAPRCCQRDCWTALSTASELLKTELNMSLAVDTIQCDQFHRNKECIYDKCPLWSKARANADRNIFQVLPPA